MIQDAPATSTCASAKFTQGATLSDYPVLRHYDATRDRPIVASDRPSTTKLGRTCQRDNKHLRIASPSLLLYRLTGVWPFNVSISIRADLPGEKREQIDLQIEEATLRYADFVAADEIFSTGKFAKVAPVIRIDDRSSRPGRFGQASERSCGTQTPHTSWRDCSGSSIFCSLHGTGDFWRATSRAWRVTFNSLRVNAISPEMGDL